jgi:cell division protein FtsB
MKRYRYNQPPKQRKRNFIFALALLVILVVVFVPGPNGLYKVLNKSYKIRQINREIENLKIKAELIESKIAKGHDPQYLKKYLMDYYQMAPKDSAK